MPRANNRTARHRRKKRIMKRAKGMVLARSSQYKAAKESIRRADAFAWRDRRSRKRDFRKLWITRISAACRERGISYSRFMNAMKQDDIQLNRKMLSEMAIHDPAAFDELVEQAKKAVAV